MKTIRFTAFSILLGLLVLVFACKKETNPADAPQTGSKILVTGQDAGTGLKSTLSEQTTVWISGSDKVGIYSAEARTLTGGGGTAIVNAEFTAATSAASSTFSGTMYWGAASTSHTFYSYYPYAAGSAARTVVPVSLATAQSQSAANNSTHIGALDFLVATPATVTSPANTNAVANEVNLRYNHLFTILEFQIKGSDRYSLKAVLLMTPSNPIAFSGGTIDITQATPATDVAYVASQTGTTTQAVVTLTDQAGLTSNNADTKVYMVINPGTQTGTCLVGLSDGTTWSNISKAAPGGGFLRGRKYVVAIDQADAAPFACGASLIISHLASNGVAPVDKTVSYGTVTSSLSGASKCWITQNLGSSNQAASVTDATEASAGWYWQFNRKQGYKLADDNTTRTPNSAWITSISEDSNWLPDNDPCTLELGAGWRIPTSSEWTNADANGQTGGWDNYTETFADVLKLHAAGYLQYSDGLLIFRGARGYYRSSSQTSATGGGYLYFDSGHSQMGSAVSDKAYGFPLRCLRD